MLNEFFTLGRVLPKHDDRFRTVINDHYDFLIKHPETQTHKINPHLAFISNYSFYRYMKEAGFEISQIYPTMVINNLTSLYDFNDKISELLIPSVAAIEGIKNSMI